MKKLCVKTSAIAGKGLFAAEPIKGGEIIDRIRGKKVKKLPKNEKEALSIPTWFGMGRKTWLDPEDSQFRYLNHSCNPNAAIVGTKTLIARKNIRANEEITVDYSMTDADPLWHMKCSCKSVKCRKVLRSIQFLPISVFRKHMPHIPKYFQRTYIRNYVKSHILPKEEEYVKSK